MVCYSFQRCAELRYPCNMFHRRRCIPGIFVATVLLLSSVEIRSDANTSDCPCEVSPLNTSCYNVSEAPSCLLSKNISILMLELMNIAQLTAPTLANVPRVQRLNIKSDSLTTITLSAFTNNPLLETLLMEVPNVTVLDPRVCRSLPRLKYLGFESGIQNLVEDQFELCPELRGVKVQGRLQKVKPGTFRNKALTGLWLSDNNLAHLPNGLIVSNPKLHYLYLNDNGIQTISAGAFRNASKLQWLTLPRNRLRTLEDGTLYDAQSMTMFDVSENEIKSLPPKIFTRSVSLRDIRLDSNKLTSLPKDLFASTTNLEYLRLEYNQLETLEPGLFRNNSKLLQINLSHNAINSLPEGAFAGQRGLRVLFLNHNHLVSLPADIFRPVTALIWMDLSRNLLQSLPEELLGNCPNLEGLFLEHNQLKTLPGRLFVNNTKLSSVSLAHNSLSSLPAELFSWTRSLQEMRLGHNPWDCTSCDVSSMATWLRSHGSIDIGHDAPRCWDRNWEVRQLVTSRCYRDECSSTADANATAPTLAITPSPSELPPCSIASESDTV